MPNLSKILAEHPEIKNAITQDDGKIYGLPAGELMGTTSIGADEEYAIYAVPEFTMINKKWLDDLGLAMPTSLDELQAVLVAFKENDMAKKVYGAAAGSTIPLGCIFEHWCQGQHMFYSGFGFTNFNSDVCWDLALGSDGKAYFQCAEDNYRDAITYFHDWYANGLVDLEMFSQDDSQFISKGVQGYYGVTVGWDATWMGDRSDDYVLLPPMSGPKGTAYEGVCNINIMSAGNHISSGQLVITKECESPINLLKFYDQWYDGETVMQLHYGPIDVYFTEKGSDGKWQSITDEEAQAKFGKSSGELKTQYEVWGPKLILSEYYQDVFYIEDRAVERLDDILNFWMPYCSDKSFYPVNVVFTQSELTTIDDYQPDFVNHVKEQEALWIRDGGPSDAEWEAYKQELVDVYAMDKLLDTFQSAYDRYAAAN